MSKSKRARGVPPKIETKYSDDYRTIIVSGIYGGHRPSFFELVVYHDEMLTHKALETIPSDSKLNTIMRTIETSLYIDPIQAKSILKWLNQHVSDYEKQFGEIPEPSKDGLLDNR